VTNKNKKRATGMREPRLESTHRGTPSVATPRRGLLDGLLSPRSADSSMPTKSTSLWRGLISTASSPGLMALTIGVTLAGWIGAIILGFQGPFSVMASFLALPPIGTSFDIAMTSRLFTGSGLIGIFVLIAVRAFVLGQFASFAVDALTDTRVDRWTLIRGLRILPVTLAVNMLALGITMVGTILSGFLGSGIGLLAAIATFAAGVYLLSFAPVIAAAEGRSMPESLARSVRAARMPGTTNLTFASIYAIGAIAVFVASSRGPLGVNPSPLGWVVVLMIGFLHVAVLTALAYRYLSVADEVPDAPGPRSKAGARG
jgi:hypothetical protein